MHTIDLLASSLSLESADPLPTEAADGVCAITGRTCQTIPRRKLLGASFRDQAILAAPESDRVGVPAWTAFTHHEDRGKKRAFYPERQSAWICDADGFRQLDRQAIRRIVLAGDYRAPWAAYATTSYKKHGALYAPVNGDGSAVWQWEMERVDCSDHDRLREVWRNLRSAQDIGLPRPVIETLDPHLAQIRKAGIEAWTEFEDWARPLHRSPLYRFLCYLLPSQEELKEWRDD